MTQYKKGDVILATYIDTHPTHVTLLKLLKDPSRDTGWWNNYLLAQINIKEKTVHWPRRFTDMKFAPVTNKYFKLTTDIESIVNFKKDYVKTVFESGYFLS